MSLQSETILGDKVRVTSRTGSTRKFVWEFEENKSRDLDAKREGSIFGARRSEANVRPMGAHEMVAKWIRQQKRLYLSSLRRNI